MKAVVSTPSPTKRDDYIINSNGSNNSWNGDTGNPRRRGRSSLRNGSNNDYSNNNNTNNNTTADSRLVNNNNNNNNSWSVKTLNGSPCHHNKNNNNNNNNNSSSSSSSSSSTAKRMCFWQRFYRRLSQTDAIILLLTLYIIVFVISGERLWRHLMAQSPTSTLGSSTKMDKNNSTTATTTTTTTHLRSKLSNYFTHNHQQQQQQLPPLSTRKSPITISMPTNSLALNNDNNNTTSSSEGNHLHHQLPSRYRHLYTIPRPKKKLNATAKRRADYGDLVINLLKGDSNSNNVDTLYNFRRHVAHNDSIVYEKLRRAELNYMNKEQFYISSHYDHTDELEYPRECVRPNWIWKLFPSCTTFHELALERPYGRSSYIQENDMQYLSHGYFRDSWRFTNKYTDDDVIFKRLRLIEDHDVDYYSLRYVQVEALIMERLTSSPRIVDIYGHCGTSILAEPMPKEITNSIVPEDYKGYFNERGRIKQRQLDKWQKEDVFPFNNYTAFEKLDIALQMAESLADLHGFKDGLIIHGDVHPDQWLISKSGQIKLNDFNNGHLADFNPVNNTYCPFYSSFGGTYKSPEEFTGDYVFEQVDTWSMGHNIYALLTGLWPFYDEFSHTTIRKRVMNGEWPYVDPRYRTRSYIEGRLVEIMEQTWAFKPSDRASIFQVVQHLRETKHVYLTKLENK